MDIRRFKQSHRVAENSDIPHLCQLANVDPTTIWIRDLPGLPFALSEVSDGPFSCTIDEDYHVLNGFDKKSGGIAKLRIRNSTVEIINDLFQSWTTPSMGGIRIYIPIDDRYRSTND